MRLLGCVPIILCLLSQHELMSAPNSSKDFEQKVFAVITKTDGITLETDGPYMFGPRSILYAQGKLLILDSDGNTVWQINKSGRVFGSFGLLSIAAKERLGTCKFVDITMVRSNFFAFTDCGTIVKIVDSSNFETYSPYGTDIGPRAIKPITISAEFGDSLEIQSLGAFFRLNVNEMTPVDGYPRMPKKIKVKKVAEREFDKETQRSLHIDVASPVSRGKEIRKRSDGAFVIELELPPSSSSAEIIHRNMSNYYGLISGRAAGGERLGVFAAADGKLLGYTSPVQRANMWIPIKPWAFDDRGHVYYLNVYHDRAEIIEFVHARGRE